MAAAPDRLIWGSDWPHTGGTNRPPNQPVDVIEPFRVEDDARNLDLLADWVPDVSVRRLILVETPLASTDSDSARPVARSAAGALAS